jgi:hypothetical protein
VGLLDGVPGGRRKVFDGDGFLMRVHVGHVF